MKTSKKRHRWTLADEKTLLANISLPADEIRDRFFKDLSVIAVKYKLKYLMQELRFNRVGPWTKDELDFLAININQRTSVIQITIPRPDKDIHMMKYQLKRGKSTNVRGPHRLHGVVATLSDPQQSALGNTQFEFARNIEHIANPGLRNTAEAELNKAIKHLGLVMKLLEINDLVKEDA